MTREDTAKKAAQRFKHRTGYNALSSGKSRLPEMLVRIDRAILARYSTARCDDPDIDKLFAVIGYAWNTLPRAECSSINFYIREHIADGGVLIYEYYKLDRFSSGTMIQQINWTQWGESFIATLDDVLHDGQRNGRFDFTPAKASLLRMIKTDQTYEKNKGIMNDIPDISCVGNYWLALVEEALRYCDENEFAIYPPNPDPLASCIDYLFT
jgi:hypothetical protein